MATLQVSEELLDVIQKRILDKTYPIGSIYMSSSSTNPGTLFGGTWTAWGAGRVPVGFASGDSDFGTSEKTGGEKTHKLTQSELASHYHEPNRTGHYFTTNAPLSTDSAERRAISTGNNFWAMTVNKTADDINEASRTTATGGGCSQQYSAIYCLLHVQKDKIISLLEVMHNG